MYYGVPANVGLDAVLSCGDGTTIILSWFKAFPEGSKSIAYNIYYSTDKTKVFSEGAKYVSVDDSLEVNIINLDPGQLYWFSVRPIEYDPTVYDYTTLPIAYDNLRYYPTSILRSDISSSSLIVPLLDVSEFLSSGVVKVGGELIKYNSLDLILNNLQISTLSDRGFGGTSVRSHNVDGYDGYKYWDTDVVQFLAKESRIYDRLYACESRFEYDNFSYTQEDGYKQVNKDLLTQDLSVSDEFNEDFPMYDYAGYHRVDPTLLLAGECVGSYANGEMGCIDGYGNVNIVRGVSAQDRNNQRQEMLLEQTGRVAVLLQRNRTGIVCACFQPNSEYPDDRCPKCTGTGFVTGYHQYFNERRSDRRILVRTGPAEESIKTYEAGLESELTYDVWTLTFPTIKPKDILVLYDMAGNEEYRYEVISVTRNTTFLELSGGQKMRIQRVRKTDPVYQIRVLADASMYPTATTLSIESSLPAILPHTHTIVVNENTNTGNISQMTSINAGHNHAIIITNGISVVQEALGHTHKIII